MTLAKLWRDRAHLHRREQSHNDAVYHAHSTLGPIEWEHLGETHIFAMTFPDGWQSWCHIRPRMAYRKEHPNRGWPAEEATLAPFRTSHVTCTACLYMWKLVFNRWKAGKFELSFLWLPPDIAETFKQHGGGRRIFV